MLVLHLIIMLNGNWIIKFMIISDSLRKLQGESFACPEVFGKCIQIQLYLIYPQIQLTWWYMSLVRLFHLLHLVIVVCIMNLLM